MGNIILQGKARVTIPRPRGCTNGNLAAFFAAAFAIFFDGKSELSRFSAGARASVEHECVDVDFMVPREWTDDQIKRVATELCERIFAQFETTIDDQQKRALVDGYRFDCGSVTWIDKGIGWLNGTSAGGVT